MVGRRLSKAHKSAALLDSPVTVLAAKDILKLRLTEVTVITTPDDQIGVVAEVLSHLNGTSTVLHTSGALSSDVLAELREQGWQTGSMHPLVSVSNAVSGAQDLRGAYWCVEGSRGGVQTAKKLITDLGARSFSIPSAAKALYHASAVMAAGNVVALFDVAIEMLMKCGLKRTEARRVLMPLLDSTVANLKRSDTAGALTGTFARGDVATVENHLGALSENELKQAEQLYRLLGLRSLKLAEQNGLDKSVSNLIEELILEGKGRPRCATPTN